MTVDRNEKIWTWSNTGTKIHAFVAPWKDKDGNESSNHLRAMCRGTIARHKDTPFAGLNNMVSAFACPRCVTLANAMWDRAEASMEPATEAHDRGYVAPVNKTVTVQGASVETLADVEAIVVKELRHAFPVDQAHAEALEMDADPLTVAHTLAVTLLDDAPGRWSYRARVLSTTGQFLGVSEGYISAPSEKLAHERLHAIHDRDRGDRNTVLGNLVLTRITRTREDTP